MKFLLRAITITLSVLFAGMLVMYAAPYLGHPLGYWASVLVVYAASSIIALGTHSGILSSRDQVKQENDLSNDRLVSSALDQALRNYGNSLTKK